MSYTAEDKLPEGFFQETLKENMATFKFYLPTEEDSLKLHYTFSNLGDLKEQLYFLWVQLKHVLKGT